MYINGFFKDYYDHIAHRLGVDKKAYFQRYRVDQQLVPKDRAPKLLEQLRDAGLRATPGSLWSNTTGPECDVSILSVAGRAYQLRHWYHLVEKPRPAYGYTQEYHTPHPVIVDHQTGGPQFGEFVQGLDELSRHMGVPVFCITHIGWDRMTIDPVPPRLASLGMPSRIGDVHMYQLLYNYLLDMRVSPDTAPPIHMTSEQKIVSHGFDKKLSFRHRT